MKIKYLNPFFWYSAYRTYRKYTVRKRLDDMIYKRQWLIITKGDEDRIEDLSIKIDRLKRRLYP